MGREIVYCEGCGKRLTEDDFDRGKAKDYDNRPFCTDCRPIAAPPPPPPQPTAAEKRATERRPAGATTSRRRGATERIPLAQAPGAPPRRPAQNSEGSKVALYVGGGLALLILIVVAVATSGPKETPLPLPEPIGPAIKPQPENRPSALEIAEERLRELEAFATPAADPQAILARCDQVRAAIRGTALEPRFKQIEAAAQERLKEKERGLELDRALAAARKIIAEDPGYLRRAEVEALLEAALKKAGPRSAEVQKLLTDYRGLCEEDAKRRDAAKKPPAKNWSELFVQATNRIGANDYPGAKTIYLEGMATLPDRRPEDLQQRVIYCIGLYNLACIYSVEAVKLADKPRAQAVDEAFKYLDWSLRSDYGRFRCPCHPQTLGLGHMAEDKDLELVRADPRYAALTKKYK